DARVVAELEVGLDPFLERIQTQFVEPSRRRAGEGLVAELRERRSAPQRQRPAQELCAFCRRGRLAGSLGQRLESAEVGFLPARSEDVARRARLDPVLAERLAQLRDVSLQHLART